MKRHNDVIFSKIVWRHPLNKTHTSCFSTASIPSISKHLRQPEIVLQNLYYVLLDILVVSFHDYNFVLSIIVGY